jgi:hypothetical protein
MSAAAARPKKIPSGSFLHVSADASQSARPAQNKELKGFAFRKAAPRTANFCEITKASPLFFLLLPAPFCDTMENRNENRWG